MDLYSDEYVSVARAAQDALSSEDEYVDGETFLEEAGRKIVDMLDDLGYTVEHKQ